MHFSVDRFNGCHINNHEGLRITERDPIELFLTCKLPDFLYYLPIPKQNAYVFCSSSKGRADPRVCQDSSSETILLPLVSIWETISVSGEWQLGLSPESRFDSGPALLSINDFNPTADRPFVLGLPTGSSPIPTYQTLIKLVKDGKLS